MADQIENIQSLVDLLIANIDQINPILQRVEEKVDNLETHYTILVSLFRGLSERVDNLETRVDSIEGILNNHTIALDAIIKMISTMQNDITLLKDRLLP